MPTGEDIAFLSGHSRNAEGAEILNRNILRNNAVRGASHSTLLDISLNHDLNLGRSRGIILVTQSSHGDINSALKFRTELESGCALRLNGNVGVGLLLGNIKLILQEVTLSSLSAKRAQIKGIANTESHRGFAFKCHALNVCALNNVKAELCVVICKRCKRYAHDNHERGRQQSQQTSFKSRFLHVKSPILLNLSKAFCRQVPQAHLLTGAVDTDIYPTPPLGMRAMNQRLLFPFSKEIQKP